MASNSSTKMRDFEEYYKDRQNRQARIDQKIGFDREYNNEQGKIAYQNTMNDLRKPASYKPLEKSGGDIPSLPIKEIKDTNKENLKKEKDKKKSFNPYERMSAKSEELEKKYQDDKAKYQEKYNNSKLYQGARKLLVDNPVVQKGIKPFTEGFIQSSADLIAKPTAALMKDKEGQENLKNWNNKVNENTKGASKISNTLGNLAGNMMYSSALPTGKLGNLTKSKIANTIIKEGSENALFEGITNIDKVINKEQSAKDYAKDRAKDFALGGAFGVGVDAAGNVIGKGLKKFDNKVSDILDIAPPTSVETGNINPLSSKPKTVSKPIKNEPIQNTTKDIKPPVEAINKPKNNIDLDNEIKKLNVEYDDREFWDIKDMGGRKVKSIANDMAELQPYLKNEAERELIDLRRYANTPETTIVDGKRVYKPSKQSNTMEIIKAQTGASYKEIEEALVKVANGKVDNALSKRIELILDDALTNGTTSVLGDEIPANMDYLDIKNVYKQMSEGKGYDDIFKSTAATIEEPKFDNSGIIRNDLAMDTTEGYKQSKHATNTMQNSPNITREVKDELKKYDFDYEATNNKETYDNALQFVQDNSALSKYLASNGTSHQDTANGIALIQKLQKEGKIEDLVTVTSKLTDDLTKAGKTVQAASILNRLTPEGKLIATQRNIKNIADDIIKKNKIKEKAKKISTETGKKESDVIEELKKKHKVPEITTKDANFIIDKMKKYENATDREKEILLGQVNALIQNKVPKKLGNKLDSYRYLNMLFNPKTLIKNVGGNVINVGAGKIRDSVGSVIDKQISKKTKIRTTSGSFDGMGTGIKKGAKNTIEDYKLGIDTSQSGKEGARSNALKDIPILGKAEDLLTLGLQLGDRPFYEGAKENFLRNYSKMNNIPIDKLPVEVLEEANNVGLEAVYQQKTALGDKLNSFKTGKGGWVGKALLPFTQTPSAILDTAINYTPVGLYRGGKNINEALATKGLDSLHAQRKGVNQLASGIVGTGAMGVGAGLAATGRMTGNLSDDYDTMQMQMQTGQQPYALKVGDTYNSLEFAQPAAMPLMMGADIYQNKGIDAMDLLSAAGNSMFSNSYLQGIPDFFNKSKNEQGNFDTGKAFSNVIGQYASQLLPFNALANAVNKTIDPIRKDTYDKDFTSKTVKQAMSKYPGLNQMLPTALDSLGNEKVHNEGMNLPLQIFNNFINPSTMTKFTPTKTEQKLLDIYNTTGETSQMPRANAPTSFSYGGETSYNPTAEEQRLYKEIVKKKMDSVNYNSDAASYEKALTEAYNEWKKQLISANGLKKKSK